MIRSLLQGGHDTLGSLKAFLVWWRSELVDLLPARYRQRLGRVIFVTSVTPLHLVLKRGPEIIATIKFDPADAASPRFLSDLSTLRRIKDTTPIHLMVPDDRILTHAVRVPLGALPHFSKLLKTEIDRWIPYKLDEVVFGWNVVSRGAKQALVEIRYIPRQALATIATPLLAQGFFPTFALLGSDGPAPIALDQFRSSERETRNRSRRIAVAILAGSALIAVIVDWNVAHVAVAELKSMVAGERRALADQALLERKMEGVAGLIKARSSAPLTNTHTLARLSAAIPSTDWLTEATLKSRTVTIRGHTANADVLMKRLEGITDSGNLDFHAEPGPPAKDGRKRFSVSLSVADLK